MRNFAKRSQGGFSLVELMIVVGIMAILATLAVPRFATFQGKARQSEARTILNNAFTLNAVFYDENSRYPATTTGTYGTTTAGVDACNFDAGWASEIGFSISPCGLGKTRYQYTMAINNSDGAGASYVISAQTGKADKNYVMPGCEPDRWAVNQDKVLKNFNNSVANCKATTQIPTSGRDATAWK